MIRSIPLLATLLAFAGVLSAAEPFPYDLRLDIRLEAQEGTGILHDELQASILHMLASQACFRSVAPAVEGEPLTGEHLIAAVRILDILDETRYDTSMAQRNDPNASLEVERAVTAYLELNYILALETSGGAVVRSKDFETVRTYRPLLDEDPRFHALHEMIEVVSRNTGRWTCRGSAKKLARDVAKAERASAETSR